MLTDDVRSLLRTGLTRSFSSLFIKVATAGLTYIAYVVLSRAMTGTEYGYFAFGLSLATVLAIAAGMGQQIAILRFWPEAMAKGAPREADTALSAGGTITIIAALAIGLALAAFAALLEGLAPWQGPVLHYYGAAVLVLPLALAEYNSSALRAQGSVWTALMPRDLVWRMALPAIVALLWASGVGLTGAAALLISAALLGLALVLQYVAARRRDYRLKPTPAGTGRYWAERGTISRWFLAGALVDTVALNADTVLIGLMVDAPSAGLYFNAFRTAGLMTLIGYAITLVIGPMLAEHYHGGDLRKAQALTVGCVWVGFGFAAIAFAIFAVFGGDILTLFGADYGEGHLILVLLAAGLLADAAIGPARTVMMLTGHERAYVFAFGGMTLLGLVAQALVLPFYGLVGAAAVNMLARIASHSLLGWWCFTKAGIDPTIFGIVRLIRAAPREAT